MKKIVTLILGDSPVTTIISGIGGALMAIADFVNNGGHPTVMTILALTIIAFGRKAKDENK